ncbi:hypothetical protein [Nitrosospira multiformis]|uniref:hypothetical protein n=1 Tax=Nitrosospira multiformis TaxID=1231 RepID=UPI001C624BBB|nr:hypothetical protein [Nitrosospira multiformis]
MNLVIPGRLESSKPESSQTNNDALNVLPPGFHRYDACTVCSLINRYAAYSYFILLLTLVLNGLGKYSGLCDKSPAFHESALS